MALTLPSKLNTTLSYLCTLYKSSDLSETGAAAAATSASAAYFC